MRQCLGGFLPFLSFTERSGKMKKTTTLKLNKEFRRLYYRGKSVVRGNIVIYAAPGRRGTTRIGITCGKSIGKAVRRNRVKRLIRESFRLLGERVRPGYDIVFVARGRAVSAKMRHVYRDMETGLLMLGIIENEKDTDNAD